MSELVTVQEQLRRYEGQMRDSARRFGYTAHEDMAMTLGLAADVIDDQARRIKALEARLPGTGAGVTPENVPSREGDMAPEPASICATDDEC